MIAPVPSTNTDALATNPGRRLGARGGLDYLGPEFLTWLWWRADVDPCFAHADGLEVFVHVDEHLEFRGERAASRRTSLRTGAPGASMDARAALRSGKLLVAARLLFARGEEEWRFTLRAEDLDVSSLRLPAPDEGGALDRLESSLSSLERFWEDLDLCLASFLGVRTSPHWRAEVEKIRVWGSGASPDEQWTAD